MNHHPDFSSSDDELDDDFEFKEFLREQRRIRIQEHTSQLSEEHEKELKLKHFYMLLMNGKVSEVVSELNNGMNINVKFSQDWTPILVAASTANYELVQELHKRGADVKVTIDGFTTLMLACNCPESTTSFEGSLKVIKLFIELGVNPNAINRKRMNALMFAASHGNLQAVEILLPITADCNAEDNQNWNALFWAVNSGNIKVVEYLVNKGLAIDRIDVRGNTLVDISRNNDFHEILDMFTPEEEHEDFLMIHHKTDFESIFENLDYGERPRFFLDTCKMLYGSRCENLIKLFAQKEVSMLQFLSSTEKDLELLGVQMPFQRRRLMVGIHQFHKYPFHPKSLPTVGRNELFSNVDVAAAILSAVKQMTCFEASLHYITKNSKEAKLFSEDKEIRKALLSVEKQLGGLNTIVRRLQEKAKDMQERWERRRNFHPHPL